MNVRAASPTACLYDVAVIGGGIVGLAAAGALLSASPGTRLLLLEKEPGLSRHQTGHNSGVIHSGLYYAPGSHKARLCVRGAAALRAFCEEQGVAFEMCGKVVVAIDAAEMPRLEELHRRGLANGVPRLERIGPERLRELEPHAAGMAALHSPHTGVVDFPGVSQALARRIEKQGGEIRTSAPLLGARAGQGEMALETPAGAFRARHVLNCAGLHADRVARLLGARPEVSIVPFRGEYHALRPESERLVRALIYPVPDPAFPFLGVHFTRRVRGGVEAGPNAVLAFRREGYRKADFSLRDMAEYARSPGFRRMARRHWRTALSEMRRSWSRALFAAALRRLVPELEARDLAPGGSGVRAQAIASDGRLLDDFHFQLEGRALHVLNAPSPAATACLAIGEEIAATAVKAFEL